MKPEDVSYGGWDHCLRLSNGEIEIIATLDVGPRIIRYGFVNGQNLFKEFSDDMGSTGGDTWKSYGGHRLWHAPEVEPRTYYPDNAPVHHAWDGKTLTLTPPEETSNRLQLSIAVTMDPEKPRIDICHRIANTGTWDVTLAPWALSVMAEAGRAVIPQERYIPHGESFSPARPLVLWYFTKMDDPRFTWGEKYIQMREDASVDAKQKIGALNAKGWAAYLLNGDVFIKKFDCMPGAAYPDLGCNCEFYTQPGFLEIESLGPLQTIVPGGIIEHRETWELHRADVGPDEAEIDAKLMPLAGA